MTRRADTAGTPSGPGPSLARWAVMALFVVSGFSGLVYEVVWVRTLTTVFGVSAYAISTVLASYMGGLALGSWLFGRFIDRHPRPLFVYGLLEGGIGAYALAVPLFFQAADAMLRGAYRLLPGHGSAAFSSARVVLAFAILMMPTTLMGATLPVLCKFFVETLERVGRETGRLYFLNTAGAVIGCATAGFVLVPRAGLRAATLVAAGGNALIAVLSIVLSFRLSRSSAAQAPATVPREAAEERRPWSPDARAWILTAYALSGFAGLAFEILWSRVLVLVFGSTVYSFSAMLSVFLLGLALGGALFSRVADRSSRPSLWFAAMQIATAFVILGEVAILDHLPSWFLFLLHGRGISDGNLMFIKFALSGAVLFPAALLFGGTFPLVSKIATDSVAHTGRRIGTLYAANTLGAIVGSLAAGFLLLRLLGTRSSLIVVAGIALAVGAATLLMPREGTARRWKSAGVATAAFLAGVLLLPPSDHLLLSAGVWFNPRSFQGRNPTGAPAPIHREIVNLFYGEGVNDTVIVNETPTERCLSLSGKILATSSWEGILPLKLLGHIPVLTHPAEARSAINIGLGIGGTVSALAAHGLDRVEVAELEPKVIEALPFFAQANNDLHANPRVKIIVEDGRNLLALRPDTYDIISSDPNDMYMTGVSNLYSREFFRLARSRLNPGGLMTQWLDVPEIAPEDFRSVLATFNDVFPHFTVWFAGRSVILVGSATPVTFDLDRLRARIGQSANTRELARLGIDRPEQLLSFLVGDEASFRTMIDGAPLNTDDHPIVEYHSARHIFTENGSAALRAVADHFIADDDFLSRIGPAGRVDRDTLLALLHGKREGLYGIADLFDGRGDDAIRHLTAAVLSSGDPVLTTWLAEAHEDYAIDAQKAGQADVAIRHYELALGADPQHLRSLANLAQIYYLAGRYNEALPLIEAAYARAPRLREILYRYGLIREALGDADEAGPLLKAAADASPDSPAVLVAYASFEQRLGRLDTAEEFYRKALAVDPSNAMIRDRLAALQRTRGRG